MDDLETVALKAQIETLASLWQRYAADLLQTSTLSDNAVWAAGYADAMDRCSQALKGLLEQWQ